MSETTPHPTDEQRADALFKLFKRAKAADGVVVLTAVYTNKDDPDDDDTYDMQITMVGHSSLGLAMLLAGPDIAATMAATINRTLN